MTKDETEEAIRNLKAQISDLELKYMRSDLISERLERIKESVLHVEQKVDDLINERTWLIRLIGGVVVVAILSLVIRQNG